MKRREFVKCVGLASLAIPFGRYSPSVGKAAHLPNIVFIVADDHATQTIGCYGSRPN
jgi:hypothetical protein